MNLINNVPVSALEDICKQIQELDASIRFAGIANKFGNLRALSYRKNLIPLLTEKETSDYAIKAVFVLLPEKIMNQRLANYNIL